MTNLAYTNIYYNAGDGPAIARVVSGLAKDQPRAAVSQTDPDAPAPSQEAEQEVTVCVTATGPTTVEARPPAPPNRLDSAPLGAAHPTCSRPRHRRRRLHHRRVPPGPLECLRLRELRRLTHPSAHGARTRAAPAQRRFRLERSIFRQHQRRDPGAGRGGNSSWNWPRGRMPSC